MERLHSVTIDHDKCKGCTNCLKRCPTEAIRVRMGKAKITTGRCIDCGECIRLCPHRAKHAIFDTLAVLKDHEYNIALPAPSLYGQFPNLTGIGTVLGGLTELGFDAVFEVAAAAELVSDATRLYMNRNDIKRPVISSACPSITRLIQIRFPNLIENVLPLSTPAELAGSLARKLAVRKTGLPPEKIGTIFITPCPAKVTTIDNPIGIEKSNLTAAIAIKEIYPALLSSMVTAVKKGTIPVVLSGREGVSWGTSGGEAEALFGNGYIAADGIENCLRILDNLEDEKIKMEFIELNACPGGCVGGVLTVENPYIAKARMREMTKALPEKDVAISVEELGSITFKDPLKAEPVLQLDKNIDAAFVKMQEIEAIAEELLGLDCGSCGAPSCRAFAEDVVQKISHKDECIFVLKESMKSIAKALERMSGWGEEQ